ncbi:MAG: hypothetical protein AAF703_22785 [Cyanobacteria bacterium P01_D01_bin.105]
MTPKSSSQIASFEAAKTAIFSHAWRSLAHSRLLPFLLLALGTVSSGVYAHAPLVSFAAMGGITLPRHRAITIALSILYQR